MLCLVVFATLLFLTQQVFGDKVSASVIVASIQGEVNSLNMVDEFNTRMDSSSVGKKVSPKTILSTGKNGKVALLFSNGTLITIKPGSRFYLRTYKQLEGIVAGVVDPGNLEEEPTQSELSGHLDYGDLIVKAPKLKKGSSMKLTSPLGVAGIRGTMFQLMAVRNSVTGDIMGGINLISGDIDFTDTGGNVVTLLSGQSIQLATSKLGEPVASKTGELVDLSSTYGPALTDGFTPPPPQSIFPNLSASGEAEESDSEEDSLDEPFQETVASAGSNFEFIHDMATEIFFEIEEAETSSSEFSFESMVLAPTVDIPTPQPEAPTAPASVTGETLAGGDIEFFQGGHPELQLLDKPSDPLVNVFDNGTSMEVEMRSPADGITWRNLDPWVTALDFLGNDITSGVQIVGEPQFILPNYITAESDAPNVGEFITQVVTYSIRDLRGLRTEITRSVRIKATRPTIKFDTIGKELKDPEETKVSDWINSIDVFDVAGNKLEFLETSGRPGFSLSYKPELGQSESLPFTRNFLYQEIANDPKNIEFTLSSEDWRGLKSEYVFFLNLETTQPKIENYDLTNKVFRLTDPFNEFLEWRNGIKVTDALGNILPYDQTKSENNGYFYFEPMPDLNSKGASDFKIIAVDWRGNEYRTFSLPFLVEASPPVVTNDPFFLNPEISDLLLTEIDSNIEAVDEFGNEVQVTLEKVFLGDLEIDFSNGYKINQLKDEAYTLTYQVVDSRGEFLEANRSLRPKVTPPTLSLPVFSSEYKDSTQDKSRVENTQEIEFADPLQEWGSWQATISSFSEPLNSDLTSDIVVNLGDANFSVGSIPLPSDEGDHLLSFKIVDPRLVTLAYPEDWEDNMTVSSSQTITVLKTLPYPTVSSVPGFEKEFVLSDQLLVSLDHNLSFTDFAGNSAEEFLQKGGIISLTNIQDSQGRSIVDFNQSSLFDLRNELYTFTYKISDLRGVSTEELLKVRPKATPPTLEIDDLDSEQSWLSLNTLEYGVGSSAFYEWLSSGISKDQVLNSPLGVVKEIISYKDISGNNLEIPDDILNLPKYPGTHVIRFRSEDDRLAEIKEENKGHWDAHLSNSKDFTVEVVSTKPVIELFYKDPRDGITADLEEIKFLVQNKSPEYLEKYKIEYSDLYSEYGDFPGEFLLSKDQEGSTLTKGMLYCKGTAFNGDNITEDIAISGNPDTGTVGTITNSLTLSLDDTSLRTLLGPDDGFEKIATTITPVVQIVDVLPPIFELNKITGSSFEGNSKEEPLHVEGILKEVKLVNGTTKVQVLKNNQPSSADYYFPDPGIKIYDNYYSENEIISEHSINRSNKYTYRYVYPDEEIVFPNIWEFPTTSDIMLVAGAVDMSIAGDYEITYSLSDPSGNIPKPITRYVKVNDVRAPVVKLYGADPLYVDLQAIEDGESRYSDPGAYAVENLYIGGNGFFDWITEDNELSWVVSYEKCNDLDKNTYDAPVQSEEDFIANIIESYSLDGTFPTITQKFRVTYKFTDKAGNFDSIQRTVELRGKESIYPYIYFPTLEVSEVDSTPTDTNIDKDNNLATLTSLIWEFDVGENQFTNEPAALVWYELGGGVREYVEAETELLFLDESGGIMSKPSYTYTNSPSLYVSSSKVNFWKSGGSNYYVEYDDNTKTYQSISDGDGDWRSVVIRYSAKNNLESGTVATTIRDIVIRLKDETAPKIEKLANSVENQFLEVGTPILEDKKLIEIITNELVEIKDSAESSIISNTISISPSNGNDDNTSLTEIGESGFWQEGEFTIKYTSVDEFENSADKEIVLSTKDRTPPHTFLISHSLFGNLLGSSFADSSSLITFPNLPEKVEPLKVFDGNRDPFENRIKVKLTSADASSWDDWYDVSLNQLYSDSPYLREDDGSSAFKLKASEITPDFLTSLNTSSFEEIKLNSSFGRSYIWFSPITLEFINDKSFQDPGILIYESSNEAVSFTRSFDTVYYGESEQIKSITVKTKVEQLNGLSSELERTYSFLDDIKPNISLTPSTDGNVTFVLIEAGESYSDLNGSYYLWQNDAKSNSVSNRSVTVTDIVDDDLGLSYNITRTYIDVSDNSNSTNPDAIIDPFNLGGVYKVRYDVEDSEGNLAEAVYRWLIVKDTIAPSISLQAGELNLAFKSTNQNNPDSSDPNSVKEFMLTGLEVSDNYENPLNAITNNPIQAGMTPWEFSSGKWDINITKLNDSNPSDPTNGQPYLGAEVYPIGPENETHGDGYLVEIRVSDSSGNTSPFFTRRLKVGDYDPPKITLIGKSLIHDFFRYGKNTGFDDNSSDPQNEELLYADQVGGVGVNDQFDSTGFQGGAHRLLLSEYNFVDPGAYAEDGNTSTYQGYFHTNAGFPDLDGDGVGEGHAIIAVSNENDMLNPAEIGIIYAFSSSQKTTKELQELLELNQVVPDINNTVFIPDVDGQSYDFNDTNKINTTTDVIEITIKYNVKDGWGNDLETPVIRRVYIYESRQFANHAFYATPITESESLNTFASLYNDSNGSNPFLTSAEKDYDGDGVSDFWEVALGTSPDNAASLPNLGDPGTFKGLLTDDLRPRLLRLEDYNDISWESGSDPAVDNLLFKALEK